MASQITSGESSQMPEQSEEGNPSLEVRDNSKSFMECFSKLYNNPRLSDIILHIGDEMFYAQRFLLVVCSEVFE